MTASRLAVQDEPEGKYLYAIIAAPAPAKFEAAGIGGRGDLVHTLTVGPLAAVVSDTPRIEYDSNRRNMMAHTRSSKRSWRAAPCCRSASDRSPRTSKPSPTRC